MKIRNKIAATEKLQDKLYMIAEKHPHPFSSFEKFQIVNIVLGNLPFPVDLSI